MNEFMMHEFKCQKPEINPLKYLSSMNKKIFYGLDESKI